MWLNNEKVDDSAVYMYRKSLKSADPKHIVIDDLFNSSKLDEVVKILQHSQNWQTQQHTYDALYVSQDQWQSASQEQRFVQRDMWHRHIIDSNMCNKNEKNLTVAHAFLAYLRSDEFMAFLSSIFKVRLTDINVAKPDINTNYFRLSPQDFVAEHADDSPGREVCLLLYLNRNWRENAGGELAFSGKQNDSISITPIYNRCVLFDPSSEGSEHWVQALNSDSTSTFRYNVTSWYWSE
jgi:Rps23 Pro-64 3,4-dihydroxylase Tpa1-like proline 4-hydroxylase